MIEQFKRDVIDGLSMHPQKTLPSKYFYDAAGSKLFVQIMSMPEYYLTRAEMEVFAKKTKQLISGLQLDRHTKFDIVELGAGDGTKTISLLQELVNQDYKFSYLPVDISGDALVGLQKMLKSQLPCVEVLPQHGDYFAKLSALAKRDKPMVLLFLGSNLGNMPDDEAKEFMQKLAINMKPGDRIILGVDLKKDVRIVLPAYNDAQGFTKDFNLNLLARINKELEANFDISNFEHAPEYDEEEGLAKSFIRSNIAQEVHIGDFVFSFAAGETIHTEISRKYDDAILNTILADSGLQIHAQLQDEAKLFADYILKKS